MNLLEVSQTIRKMRLQRGITVEQLARKSGFSKGFISQVENFRQTPSLKALVRIAEALEIPVGSLFDAETTPQHTFGNLNRGVEIPRNDSVEYGIHYHSLAYRQVGRSMDPFLIEYTPAKPRGFLFHESEEFFVLLEGTLEFFLYDKDESHVMHAGETLYLKPNVPHRVALARSCTYAK